MGGLLRNAIGGAIGGEIRKEMKERVDLLLSVQTETNSKLEGLTVAIRELAVAGQKIDAQLIVDLHRLTGELKDVSKEVTKALDKTIKEIEKMG